MDTSPSGTGTSAGMAVLHARNALAVGAEFRTEGLLGGVFRCGIARETQVGEQTAIVPRIGGRAWITGYARYVLQDDDPFPEGFVMGDIWPAANTGSTAELLAARASEPPALAHAVLISGTAAPVPDVAERLERPGRLMLGDDERTSPRCISTGAMRTANRQLIWPSRRTAWGLNPGSRPLDQTPKRGVAGVCASSSSGVSDEPVPVGSSILHTMRPRPR